MNRYDAIAAGHRTYSTGRLCSHGHLSDRYTSTGNCLECLRARQKDTASKLPGAPIFTYRLHPEDHAAALAYCQSLDLQRGRQPSAGQALTTPPAPRAATPEEVAEHRRRILGDAADMPAPAAPSALTREQFEARYPGALPRT